MASSVSIFRPNLDKAAWTSDGSIIPVNMFIIMNAPSVNTCKKSGQWILDKKDTVNDYKVKLRVINRPSSNHYIEAHSDMAIED